MGYGKIYPMIHDPSPIEYYHKNFTCQALRFMYSASCVIFPDNGDGADVARRCTAQIMGQSELGIFKLPFPGPAVELEIHLVNHPEAGSADGTAEALQPAVHLAGNTAPVKIVESIHNVFYRTTPGGYF